MSFEISLQAIPNQTFSLTLDDHIYDITLKEANGIMAAFISRDNVRIVSGMRVVCGYPLIPYEYLESGNFIFLTADNDLPYYTQFGITQSLIYFSREELEVIRGT